MPINYIITSRKESKAGFFSVAQLWVIYGGQLLEHGTLVIPGLNAYQYSGLLYGLM